MKEIDQYASMEFAMDVAKGTDMNKQPTPQESVDYDNPKVFKFKPVLGVGYSERIRNSHNSNFVAVDP